MTARRQYLYTAEEYLKIERAALAKSEFYGGEIFAMPGSSRAHSLISTNLAAIFTNAFKVRNCNAFNSDLRIKVEALGSYTYPDLSVVCDAEQYDDDTYLDTILNPLLLVEVLSPSTEAFGRGTKFANYQLIASLQEYVLVSQDTARIESYRRQADGQTWLLSTASGVESELSLASVSVNLVLAEVYNKVNFPSTTRIRIDQDDSPQS